MEEMRRPESLEERLAMKSDVEREMPSEEVYEYYEDDENCEVEGEEDENQELFDRLADLLTRSVIELKGPPPPLTLWSWHDIPDQIRALKEENEELKKKLGESEEEGKGKSNG